MRLIPSKTYRRMPWKNGGGETIEIAAAPAGAALDAFDWRVSMARVAGDGPFSLFPNIDRTLCVLTGEGIILDIAGRCGAKLDRESPPYAFPGDVAVSSRLIDGPIDDLNVMTRRGRFRHHVARIATGAPVTIARRGDVLLAIIFESETVAISDNERLTMADGDTLILENSAPADIVLSPRAPATLYIIDLWRC